MRTVACVAVVGSLALVAPACAEDELKAFCDDLERLWQMTELRDDIDRADRNAIEKDLLELEDLADDAPDEIAIDLHLVVDAVVKTVRSVIDVTGPGGETIPPDQSELNAALADVAKSSQSVEEFADKKCGFRPAV